MWTARRREIKVVYNHADLSSGRPQAIGPPMSANRPHNPPNVPKPPSRHAQAVESRSGLRWLHISGQIGFDAEGRLASSEVGQHEQIWKNIGNLLSAARMQFSDLVKVTAYVTHADQVAHYRDVRDRVLDGIEVASTLVIVAALARPEWVVEIDAVAAAAL
jgi:2-iminobutanoate/2-iminopropanoate deaminase